MDKNTNLVESIEKICADLSTIFEKMKTVPGMYDLNVENNQRLCALIPQQIRDGIVKIAVVGTIKSGKSTFINSLLMRDILKRGAGVVTSVVTRVKRGDTLRAKIFFKSWDEINHEIEKALKLTPLRANEARAFDLRRKSDRSFLRSVQSGLCSGEWSGQISDNCMVQSVINENGLRPEAILISNALDGYDEVKKFVHRDSSDAEASPLLEYTEDSFMEHQRFTGIGCNAFFVKDVLIEVPESGDLHASSMLHPSVEIADCQGSDSTDSSHISHIEDYLLSANMLVYLISSRTGLREADLKFLSMIKKMGILNNISFIINVDFNEHDSLDSLIELEKSVKQGLGYFIQNPVVYTLSSLFNLFLVLEKDLPHRDLDRLRQWQQQAELVEYAGRSHRAFEEALRQKIETELFSIVLENHIERLRIIIKGTEQRGLLFMKLLSGDLENVSHAAKKLKQLKEQARRFESLVDDSIERAVEGIKRDTSSAIKHFFDKKRGIQAKSIREFLFGSAIYNESYKEMISTSGFNHALYCMFQDFRSELDLFMAQQFNPAVIELIQEQEQHIETQFQALYQSCYMAPSKIYSQICDGGNDSTSELFKVDKSSSHSGSVNQLPFPEAPLRAVDLNGAKRILGLNLPKTAFATAYSAKIRFDAMARFSFYSLIKLFGKVTTSMASTPPRSRALKESAKQIRKEMLKSVMLHFDAYQSHVQTEYIFPLIQAVARDFRDKLIEMFRMCGVESEHIEQLIADDKMDKSGKLEHINVIVSDTDEIAKRMNELYIEALS